MKSAYELAMSRLEKTAPGSNLSNELKLRLAEIDSEYEARIAEKRIFLEGEIAREGENPAAQASLREQLAREIAALSEKREAKKDEVRKRG